MTQIPLMILGDSPDLQTGLARIGRDLAALLSQSPRFRVGCYGFGGSGSQQLPFQQYVAGGSIENGTWPYSLPRAWRDFSRGEPGVLFTIWDLSRLLGIAQPNYMPDCGLKDFLLSRPFQLWGYFPLDASGPGGKLSVMQTETLMGFNRILTTSPWAKGVLDASLGRAVADWIPHGIDGNTWRPQPNVAKQNRIGVVATNQPRKDWGMVAAVCHELSRRDPSLTFWWHTDLNIRHWSIPALLADFGLESKVSVTYEMNDHQMAEAYASCRLTLAPGLGEGFGYPIWESLACGTPVIHGDYASGADLMKTCKLDGLLVRPHTWRLEGQHDSLRPVYEPEEWIQMADLISQYEVVFGSVEHLYWKNLKYPWMRWFEEGI